MEKNVIPFQYYKSPVGELIVGSFQDKLVVCDWRYRKMRTTVDKRLQDKLHANFKEESTDVIQLTISQLNEYFEEKRKTFTIPLEFVGTEFQQSVWKQLQAIPYGKTETYLGLSKKLGNEKAIRAVASANGANAISILIPCHRIIGSNNELIGYAGGLPAKKKLLKLEKAPAFTQQLDLF